MAARRVEFSPAMIASVLLHAGVFALAFVAWPGVRDLPTGSSVPVNIVSNAPTTNLRQAVQAPEEQVAQTEAPTPEAPPEPASPDPPPVPTPPQPQPKRSPPAPTPPAPKAPAAKPAKAAEKAPARPAPKTPAQKSPGLDLDALAADVAKAAKSSGSRNSSAAKGATRQETAKVARPDMGSGDAANAIRGLSDELQRRWNPNCEVEGGRDVKIRVLFTLGPGGQVVGQVDAGGQERSSNTVVQAAAERAIRAVYAAAPFKNLPRDFYGDRIAVNFNAREACS